MKKVGVIGLGYVGKAYAYSLINQDKIDELVLIDSNKDVLESNYLDLKDSAVYSSINVVMGDYNDLSDADVIVITAGKNQQKNETRLDLLKENNKIMKSIISNINNVNYNGFLLIATNPVDICTYLAGKYSNINENKIIGSGTSLDTIRLKRILKEKLDINYSLIDTYVLGEHGDSSLVSWSNTKVDGKNINNYLNEKELKEIEDEVHNSAYEIINKKSETSFGIGRVLSDLTNNILFEEGKKVIISTPFF